MVDQGKIKDAERLVLVSKAESDGCFEASGEMVLPPSPPQILPSLWISYANTYNL